MAFVRPGLVRMGFTIGIATLTLACEDRDHRTIERIGSVNVGASANSAWTPVPNAVFYRKAYGDDADDCDVTLESGTCRLWSCQASAFVPAQPMGTIAVGKVSISSSTATIELDRDADGYYRNTEIPAALWQGDDSLSLSITGSKDFPTVAARLRAPLPIVVTRPVLDATPLELDGAIDLPIEWTTPRSGMVLVAISVETASSADATPVLTPGLDCLFAAANGSAVIPGALLSALPRPENLSQYYLDVVTASAMSNWTNDAWLDFRATWTGLSSAVLVR